MYSPSYASVNVQQEPEPQYPITERSVVSQPEAPQTLETDLIAERSAVEESIAEAPDSSVPRIVIGGALTSEAESDAVRSSSPGVTASSRRTVRKRKAKQVRQVAARPVAASIVDDREVAASEPAASESIVVRAGAPSSPTDAWSLGQVQGRSLTGFWVPAVEVSDLTEALSW